MERYERTFAQVRCGVLPTGGYACETAADEFVVPTADAMQIRSANPIAVALAQASM
jgi:hypothetical protein